MTTNNHPANGPVSLDRLHQIREILSKAAAQSDGGNLGYAMADAVKVIDGAIAEFGNPCVGVDKYPKPQRDRYITDEEYLAIYDCATDPVKAAMEIAYLCAARVSDVLKMDWNQIMDKGIFIQQGKTGVKQIKAWTDRLHSAVNLCRKSGEDGAVIKTMYGERYSYKGFNEAWRKARNAAAEKIGRPLDCTFHDLKAKGISDYEGSGRDKQKFSGHKTESQVLVYDRKVKISPTLNRKM